MDDIKLFAKNKNKLKTLIQAVRTYTGIEKYAMLIMKSRKWQMTEATELPNQGKIKTFGEKETYKYLEILEVDIIKPAEIKEKIKKENLRRRRKLLETKLYDRNLMDCLPCNIPRNILKVDKRRNSTKRPENKKSHDDA